MSKKIIDKTWQYFDRLTVLCRAENSKSGNPRWLCLCNCDNYVTVSDSSLRKGKAMSCGCHKQDQLYYCPIPKYSHTKLYGIWESIKQRCYNPNVKQYKDYGGRGISMCDEWHKSFFAFREWAFVSGYKQGLQIDRIDNDKGYSPGNCRFVSRKEQMRNRRNSLYFCDKLLIEIAEESGIPYKTLHGRLKRKSDISYSQLVKLPNRKKYQALQNKSSG